MPDLRNYMALIPQKQREWVFRGKPRNNYQNMKASDAKIKVVNPNVG